MQIILMTKRLSAAKRICCETRHIVALSLVILCVVCGISALFTHLSITWRLPFVERQIANMKEDDLLAKEEEHSTNLQALANSIGQLQAKMTQLEGMAHHFSEQTGISLPKQVTPDNNVAGQGGPFVPAPLSEESLHEEIKALAFQLQEQSVALSVLESGLRERMVRRELLPSVIPVSGARIGSSFGPRFDPFGRGHAFHEGMDFVAPHGTPIMAVASGVVVKADYHHEFGKMIEINHGGELITRYAHMSEHKVAVGDAVRRGQVIGLIGSTGRSTGPHLHFEVRSNNIPINPNKFFTRR